MRRGVLNRLPSLVLIGIVFSFVIGVALPSPVFANHTWWHRWFRFTRTQSQPDLIVQALAVNPSSPVANQPATVTAVINNQGSASAAPSVAGFYTNNAVIGYSDDTPTLPPGATASVTISLPAYPAASPKVCADLPYDTVAESNETNNCKDAPAAGGGGGTSQANLKSELFTNPGVNPYAGVTMTFTGVIRNVGPASSLAGHSTARFCIDNANCLTSINGQVGERSISILSGGTTSSVLTSDNWITTAGSHRIYLCADVGQVVPESNEADNCADIPLNVQNNGPPPATLTVDCRVSAPSVKIGEQVTFQALPNPPNTPGQTFLWTGDDNLQGTATPSNKESIVSKTYSTAGTKNATIKVTAGTLTATKTCSVTVNPPPITVSCAATPTNPQVRQEVTWRAAVTNPPAGSLSYTWSGADSLSGTSTDNFIKKTYTSAGAKTATVTVAGVNGNCSVTVAAAPIGGVTIFGTVEYAYGRTVFTSVTPTVAAHAGIPVGLYLGDTKLEEIVTDDRGSFTFTKHPNGQKYTVKVVFERFEPFQRDILVPLAQHDIAWRTFLFLSPRAMSSASGLLVYVQDPDGHSIEGAFTVVEVVTEPSGLVRDSARYTDRNGLSIHAPLIDRVGVFRQLRLPPDVRLTVSAPGYVSQQNLPVNLSATESLTSLTVTLSLRVAGARTTHIHFKEKDTERSVQNVHFTIESSTTSQRYFTATGNRTLALDPSTTYTLAANAPTFLEKTIQFRLEALAGDQVVVEMSKLTFSCDDVTVNGGTIRFCFDGVIANTRVKPNVGLLQSIAARIIAMNSTVRLVLPRPYPAKVIITDDNRTNYSPTIQSFDGLWDNPNVKLYSFIRTDSDFLAVVTHEMGHAYYDALTSVDRQRFDGFYANEQQNANVFQYENNFDDRGHTQNAATEAMASLIVAIIERHAQFHQFLNDTSQPALAVIRQLIQQKHDFLHRLLGIQY
ncbi:MAG: CARDB domain-containing protein [Patescibacteria group bacterium]